jgi:ketosteroid isomerase-like protein
LERLVLQLQRREAHQADLMVKRDVGSIEPLLADDCILVAPDGSRNSKSEALSQLEQGECTLEFTEMSDTRVRMYGDTSVVTFVSTEKSKYMGQDVSGRYRVMDVWVRNDGKWQIVASQATWLTDATN